MEQDKDPRQTAFFFATPPTGQEHHEADAPHADVTDLDALAERARDCAACGLRCGCQGVVFGEGDPGAQVMFVGEGPGAREDEQGRPFVGPAGQLLDRILAACGWRREQVYIANIVKCRPPGNRLPTPEEVERCSPWLAAQIRLIRPRVIICLGALATQTLVDPQARITRVRGRWFEHRGIPVMPTFHPAAVLRDPSKKRPVWEDFKQVVAALSGDGPPPGESSDSGGRGAELPLWSQSSSPD